MLGTGRVGEAVVLVEGDTERTARFGEKKDVNLEDVFDRDEDMPLGAVGEEDEPVERLCGEGFVLDALLRGIVQRRRLWRRRSLK